MIIHVEKDLVLVLSHITAYRTVWEPGRLVLKVANSAGRQEDIHIYLDQYKYIDAAENFFSFFRDFDNRNRLRREVDCD